MPTPDRKHFENLLGPVHEAAFRFCLRLCATRPDAEDLYHDAILVAWRGLSGLKDPERFSSWFFQIIVNHFRNRLRRDKWRRLLPWIHDDDHAANLPSLSIDPRGQLDARRSLNLAMRALTADDRSLIVLFELEGHSVAELSRIWNAPEGTIKSRLARARAKMRDAIMQHRAASKIETAQNIEEPYGLHANPQPTE